MIRILITDDHPVIRYGMRQILEGEKEISLIDEASNGIEMSAKLRSQDYDIVLLDISLPDRSGLDLIAQVKKIRKNAAVLIFSIHSEDAFALAALKAGASGYVPKSTPPDEVVRAIKRVAAGDKYISPVLAEHLADALVRNSSKNPSPVLSIRESEVLNYFASGITIGEIARRMNLSPKTVGTYRDRLLSKLNLKSTTELIRYSVLQAEKGGNKPDNE
jgi:two-component system, NarL family, invasion response regulator UvrY